MKFYIILIVNIHHMQTQTNNELILPKKIRRHFKVLNYSIYILLQWCLLPSKLGMNEISKEYLELVPEGLRPEGQLLTQSTN